MLRHKGKDEKMTALEVRLKDKEYRITVGEGLLSSIEKYINLERRVLIVTDCGVPEEYAKAVAGKAKEVKTLTLPMGEGTKSFSSLERITEAMLELQMGRKDAVVAVGGGVIGDLTGFAASMYMRGIDFYNVPTTLLSEVDSSVGGKTAINFNGIKNVVGAFYQPKAVVIDTKTLETLPDKRFAEGMGEVIKMAATSDAELFSYIEDTVIREPSCAAAIGKLRKNAEIIIEGALKIKRAVVEEDELETGLRKVLNFGHTLGHGIESVEADSDLFHGECVALGMLPMCSPEARSRITRVLKAIGLPTEYNKGTDSALALVSHDKKCSHGEIDVVYVEKIGSFEFIKMTIDEFKNKVKTVFK